MKLPLNEPLHAKYLYISPANIVHVFMPVVSGTSIGLDNTCRAVYSLQEFFGKGNNSNQQTTLKGELLTYQEALNNDLSLLGSSDTPLAQRKQERLTQINAYLDVIKQLENHPELNGLNSGFPSYPRPLESLMQNHATSNLYSMVLRPTAEDGYLRSEGANPIFSVAHKSVARNIDRVESPLQQALIQAYRPLTYEARDSKSQVIQQASAQFTIPVDFEKLRTILRRTVEALQNVSIDFSKTKQGKALNQQDIDFTMGFNPKTTPPKDYIEALLGYCASDLFDTVIESPFKTLTNAESWSVATQFLLGMANIYCVTQDKTNTDTNWGRLLDSKPDLSQSLAQMLAQAQQENHNIEDACFAWINAHQAELKLNTDLWMDDIVTIKERFTHRYAEIKDSPHFDEFFLLDTQKKGDFVIHQGNICTSFAKFASLPHFNLSQELTQSLERACSNTNTLSTEIPHHNSIEKGEVEIKTTNMDSTALQALYERINTQKDPKLKAKLHAQLKHERPDFQPQIDAKQFLQHVAYGEQNEAEALLQKDPELAQELLKAHTIPFTDYSGRTFNCTAYEYAYWAKDSHMQRMLEKYIRPNEETRQFIHQRVQAIEAPVNASEPSTFFANAEPRGLTYTTQDKDGQTNRHCNAHFDLSPTSPLQKALKHYIEVFNQTLNKTDADWAALDKIWVEEVGRAQRGVPAHIAHEYCHPDRFFYDITKNKAMLDASKSTNLKRQLKFYNFDTGNIDSWFVRDSYALESGLGFSFGILRDAAPRATGRRGVERWAGEAACIDLAALEAIDEMRTRDLTQSLDNLSQPLTAQASQSHGL